MINSILPYQRGFFTPFFINRGFGVPEPRDDNIGEPL